MSVLLVRFQSFGYGPVVLGVDKAQMVGEIRVAGKHVADFESDVLERSQRGIFCCFDPNTMAHPTNAHRVEPALGEVLVDDLDYMGWGVPGSQLPVAIVAELHHPAIELLQLA